VRFKTLCKQVEFSKSTFWHFFGIFGISDFPIFDFRKFSEKTFPGNFRGFSNRLYLCVVPKNRKKPHFSEFRDFGDVQRHFRIFSKKRISIYTDLHCVYMLRKACFDEILNRVSNFTISIRKKIFPEIRKFPRRFEIRIFEFRSGNFRFSEFS
jgi:hypothetical protein